MLSSYNHQDNGQVETYVQYVKCTMKKCFHTNKDVNLALLYIRNMPIGNALPSLATVLFKKQI